MFIITNTNNVVIDIVLDYVEEDIYLICKKPNDIVRYSKVGLSISSVANIPFEVVPQKYKYENNLFNLNEDYKESVYSIEHNANRIIISKAKFLKRLTFEELNTLTNYEKSISTSDTDYEQKCMAMKTLWNLFDKFIEVDLGDSEWVGDFLQIVVWTGLITLERAIAITTP